MKSSTAKRKTCKECKEKFLPFNTTQRFCGPKCALAGVRAKKEKEFRKETRKLKKKLRDEDRGYWVKKAQEAFNKYIRARDSGRPCISCDRSTGAKMNAGHYLTVGGHPELRFEEDNCHLQCEHCNTHLSGNIARYRINLIEKIGLKRVEWLEGPHGPKKYTIDDLKEIKAKYSELSKL